MSNVGTNINSSESHGSKADTKAECQRDKQEEVDDWSELGKTGDQSTEELVAKMHGMLAPKLKLCLQQEKSAIIPDHTMELITCQFYGFVHRISTLYSRRNKFHNFMQAVHVVQTANHLWDKAQHAARDSSSQIQGALDWDPWNRFILLFVSLVQGVMHNGSTNEKLEKDNHPIYQRYGHGRKSCFQRQAIHCTMIVLADEFPELYDEIIYACPKFLALARRVILAMDVDCNEVRKRLITTFSEKVIKNTGTTRREIRERTEAVMEQIAAMAAIGHYSQDYEVFKRWNQAQFQEVLLALRVTQEPQNSRAILQQASTAFFKHIVLPLLDRVEAIIPKAYCNLRECVASNMTLWDKEAASFPVWTISVAQSIDTQSVLTTTAPRVDRVLGQTVLYSKTLVNVMVKMLLSLLKRVIVSHDIGSTIMSDRATQNGNTKIIDKEVAAVEFSRLLREEVHDFVATIASGYRKNEFHRFDHAINVAAVLSLFLTKIQKSNSQNDGEDDNVDPTFGNGLDPLVQFSVVFAAFVHDVGHTGVPMNSQLAKEKSVAVDTAWNLLLQDRFSNFRRCIYDDPGEGQRFRQLVINSILAMDSLAKERLNAQWEASTGNGSSDGSSNKTHLQATSTIELLIQASDVAHTMQQWPIYTKWSERHFSEMYAAFVSGRSDKDPSKGWYKGELWSFDHQIIPMASKLQECQVFGDEILKYAKQNRQEWESRGEQICRNMLKTAQQKYPSTTQTKSKSTPSPKTPVSS